MENASIKEIVETAISNLSRVAEVNTIVGQPLVTMDGTTIVPVSQITFAFMAGGGEYGNKSAKRGFQKDGIEANFAGGSGGGATLTPVCFLVVGKNGVKIIEADKGNTIEKIFDVAKDVVSAFKA